MNRCANRFVVYGLIGVTFIVCMILGYISVENHNKLSPPKVTVVVLVSENEFETKRFLESVVKQTLKKIEVVCVCKKSNYISGMIISDYVDKDSRIKFVLADNEGTCGRMKNLGIKASKGEYLLFFDDSDVLFPYACEKSVESAERFQVDIMEFGHINFSETNLNELLSREHDFSRIRVEKRSKSDNTFDKFFVECESVKNKIYNRSFIMRNKLAFCEEPEKNDNVIFNAKAFSLIYKIVKDDNPFCILTSL